MSFHFQGIILSRQFVLVTGAWNAENHKVVVHSVSADILVDQSQTPLNSCEICDI